MTSIDKSLDFGTIQKSRTDAKTLWRAFCSVLASYRGRNHMIRLDGFSDSQLADIGLNRCDLSRMTQGTITGDAFGQHSREALIRRTQLYFL